MKTAEQSNIDARIEEESRRREKIGETKLQSAKRLMLEGKDDMEIMRICDISPQAIGQLRRRIREEASLKEAREAKRNDQAAAARVDGIAAPAPLDQDQDELAAPVIAPEPAEELAEENRRAAESSPDDAAVTTQESEPSSDVVNAGEDKPSPEDDYPFETVTAPAPRPIALPIWNAHACQEMPKECLVIRENGESSIVKDSSQFVGPINVCPWCGGLVAERVQAG